MASVLCHSGLSLSRNRTSIDRNISHCVICMQYMFVHVCVYVHVCMYACTCMCPSQPTIYNSQLKHVHVHVHVCMCVCVCV